MSTYKLTIVLLVVLFSSTVARAEDEDSFASYDSLVSELKSKAERSTFDRRPSFGDWGPITMHGGLGLTATYVSTSGSRFRNLNGGLLKGFQAHFGLDLASSAARGELAFRNFGPELIGNNMEMSLRELEARIVFLPELRESLRLRMGGGLSARTLQIRSRLADDLETQATPFYSLFLGFEHLVAETVSIGPDFAYRSSLDASSIDKSAWDACFRLNASF